MVLFLLYGINYKRSDGLKIDRTKKTKIQKEKAIISKKIKVLIRIRWLL